MKTRSKLLAAFVGWDHCEVFIWASQHGGSAASCVSYFFSLTGIDSYRLFVTDDHCSLPSGNPFFTSVTISWCLICLHLKGLLHC